MRGVNWLLPLLFIAEFLFAQNLERKHFALQRLTEVPQIDGNLTDAGWSKLEPLQDFIQYSPANGLAERQTHRTVLKIGYTDEAIYVAAMMYDSRPDSILTQLTQRDDLSGNTDWIGIFINPFNDGLHDFNFWVTAAGVQADSRTTSEGDDIGWNTVWTSQVAITDSGWTAELKIPYHCLRFPQTINSTWGFNSIRSIRRYREEFSWSFLDRNLSNLEVQAGFLEGINNIQSPIRLSIMPNITGGLSFYKGELESQSFNAGADIKYGLNEGFTLDITLLPDFSQVAFDNQILNLGPFENRFDENRQFFKEGIELFNKGDLFYSRRIGGVPENITGANADSLNNVIVDFTRMLNATKISGRTGRNLGIGVLNAITANNFITGVDATTGEEQRILTEPLTNYNIISLDQRFWRNSSVSFINTNVWREGPFRDANVSSLFTSLADRQNVWRLNYQLAYSAILIDSENTAGYKSKAQVGKEAGKVRFSLSQDIESDNYDQRDLGFQQRNNKFNHSANITFQNIQPFWRLNRIRVSITGNYNMLYAPRKFERSEVRLGSFALFKNWNAIGYDNEIRPGIMYDYFEPRFWGKFYVRPSSFWQEAWFSSDYRKMVAIDLRAGNWYFSDYGTQGYYFTIEPRYRVNDHLMLIATFNPAFTENGFGWVNQLDANGDSIVFGLRDINEFVTSLTARYVFNPNTTLALNFRHYWSNVRYKEYWLLKDDGYFQDFPDYPVDHNINFNTLNIDVRFSWWFAPGSELVLLYRNSLADIGGSLTEGYFYNLSETLNTPQHHSISIRLVYFLDFHTVAQKFRHDNSNQYSQTLWQRRSTQGNWSYR